MTSHSIEDRQLAELIEVARRQCEEALLPSSPLLALLENVRSLRFSIQRTCHKNYRAVAWQHVDLEPLKVSAYLCCLNDFDAEEDATNDALSNHPRRP